MDTVQTAGGSIVNLIVNGDGNNISINTEGLESDLLKIGTSRKYKILICSPSAISGRPDWLDFSDRLFQALLSSNFEIVHAGSQIPRNDTDELIYLAEKRHLLEKHCHALLILACDNTTLSQLTHLTSVVFGKKRVRKEIVVIPDNELFDGNQYFEEGALKLIRNLGFVFDTSGRPPNLDLIDKIVSKFNLCRYLIR